MRVWEHSHTKTAAGGALPALERGSLPGYLGDLTACTVVIFLLAVLPEQERSAPVQVGVSFPEEGGEAFWALLEARSGVVITFICVNCNAWCVCTRRLSFTK